MRKRKIVTVMLLLACLPVVLFAENPTSSGIFFKQVPGTDRQIPIDDATLADKVYFHILIGAEDGEHSLQVNVYDGSGREVFRAESVLLAEGGRGGVSVSYSFNARRDAPGTWWYVAALDEKVVVSNSLEVSQ
jgi:hypothetical protein